MCNSSLMLFCTAAQGMILSNLVEYILSCCSLNEKKIHVQRQLKMAKLVGLFEQPLSNMEALEHFASTILKQRSLHLCQHT